MIQGFDFSSFNIFVNLMNKLKQLTASDLCKFGRLIPFIILKFRLHDVSLKSKFRQVVTRVISLFSNMANNPTYKLIQPPFLLQLQNVKTSYLCQVPFPHASSPRVCPLVNLSVSFYLLQFDRFLTKETSNISY